MKDGKQQDSDDDSIHMVTISLNQRYGDKIIRNTKKDNAKRAMFVIASAGEKKSARIIERKIVDTSMIREDESRCGAPISQKRSITVTVATPSA